MKTSSLVLALALLASCGPKTDPPRGDSAPAPVVRSEPALPEPQRPPDAAADTDRRLKNPMGLSEEEWKKKLTPEEYYVCRQQGTESPFTGTLLNYHGQGTFVCAACGNPLFDSKTKFESGTGWPSFYQPLSKAAVSERGDLSHGMTRVEVNCAKCGSHLGHVFDDGPAPTGLRYCMNSVALKVQEKKQEKQ